MESLKIKNFELENKDISFPRFTTLTSEETQEIRNKLYKTLNFSNQVSLLELTQRLNHMGVILKDVNVQNENFHLDLIFNSLNLIIEPDIFINWYQFDCIDRMNFNDLVKFFDDIWYPGSDDIEIFDSSFKWMMSVDHEGYIKIIKLGQ